MDDRQGRRAEEPSHDTGAAAAAPRRAELWSIQYLRAAAAIAVVVFHCTQGAPQLDGLRHGVDLFFVISGFIMVALTQCRPIGPARFLADRVARIVPSYWLATLLTFLAFRAGIAIFGASGSYGQLVRSLLFVPADNGSGHAWPVLYLGWTLNYEMFFYVVFAVALTFGKRERLGVLTVALVGAVIAGYVLRPSGAAGSTYTSPMLLEFLSGAWLGATFGIELTRSPPRRAALLSIAILAAFLLLCRDRETALYGGIAIVLLAGALLLERAGLVPMLRILKFLGDASFAIYLYQQLAFTIVELPWHVLDAHAGYHVRGHSLLNVVAAIATGSLVYVAVERPVGRWTRAGLGRLFGARIGLNAARA